MARILIVDDDPALLRLLSLRLREEGHEAIAAASGEAALAQLDQALPQLLITDLRMGGMDGLQLFDAVHRRHPLLPVLILTAHGTIPDAVRALQKGVFGYLPKPFEAQELMAEVRRALAAAQALGADMPGEVPGEAWREAILTRSPRMEQVLAEARLVAQSDAAVVIQGPSGSGKELLARAIHAASPRALRPLVAVNCGAIPENLVESELFGHVKGAFTGAMRDRAGLFAEARGGTLFLDEVADLPLPAQVKLLRVLQEHEVRPVGATRTVPVDARVVAATNMDLERAVADHRFRHDLYYRLSVVVISLPPLRERRGDIPLLIQQFLRASSARRGRTVAMTAGAVEALTRYDWPGNVRELENTVERLVVFSRGDIDVGDLPAPITAARPLEERLFEELPTLDELERRYLVHVLEAVAGNRTRAAETLGVDRRTLYRMAERFGIDLTDDSSAKN